MSETYIDLLREVKAALINRDAVHCYNSGTFPCNCTLCKIDREIKKAGASTDVSDMLTRKKEKK